MGVIDSDLARSTHHRLIVNDDRFCNLHHYHFSIYVAAEHYALSQTYIPTMSTFSMLRRLGWSKFKLTSIDLSFPFTGSLIHWFYHYVEHSRRSKTIHNIRHTNRRSDWSSYPKLAITKFIPRTNSPRNHSWFENSPMIHRHPRQESRSNVGTLIISLVLSQIHDIRFMLYIVYEYENLESTFSRIYTILVSLFFTYLLDAI